MGSDPAEALPAGAFSECTPDPSGGGGGPAGAPSLYIQRYTVSGFFYVLLRMNFMEGFILFLFYFYFLD